MEDEFPLGKTAAEINNTIAFKFKLENKELILWDTFQTFFQKKKNWKVLLEFLDSSSKISLRVINAF